MDRTSRAGGRGRRRAVVLLRVGAAALAVALLLGLGSALAFGQSQLRTNLVQRFQLRGTVAARFLASYSAGLLAQERLAAGRWLSGSPPSIPNFVELTQDLGFQAAVLLDGQGRALAVYPSKPSLIGTKLSSQYAHLRRAVAGHPTISNVVPSAAKGIPVVAFAVPFAAPGGERVYSGALAVSSSTLGAYLHSLISIPGTEVFLQDSTDRTIASSLRAPPAPDLLARTNPQLHGALAHGEDGTYAAPAGPQYFVSQPVKGTPWKLVLAVPESVLFAPIGASEVWVSWASFGGLVVLSVTVVVVLMRLAAARRAQVQYRDELISHVSHELRTPLAAIHQFTSILLDGIGGPLTEEQRRYLGISLRNTEQLNRMVTDLVDSARGANALRVEPAALDLVPLLRTVVSGFRERAAQEGVDLTVDLQPNLPLVFADGHRVNQIVANLVDNAIKFSRAGGRVEVGCRADAEGWVTVDVSDTGIGLPPGPEAQVFERLFQGDVEAGRGRGLGLGLHLCKVLVERQGGTIRAERRSPGSRFSFTLPIAGFDRYHPAVDGGVPRRVATS